MAECTIACAELGISFSGKQLSDGKVCYKGGKAVCNQDGGRGSKASTLCKTKRNQIAIIPWKTFFSLSLTFNKADNYFVM